MAVISILLALMLPAIQMDAGESARRTQCRNNLKQLGLAVQQFAETNSTNLPPADLARFYATWAVHLLPYLDELKTFNNWNLNQKYYVQAPTAGLEMGVFHCPSNTDPDCCGGHHGCLRSSYTGLPGGIPATIAMGVRLGFADAPYVRCKLQWSFQANQKSLDPGLDTGRVVSNRCSPGLSATFLQDAGLGG